MFGVSPTEMFMLMLVALLLYGGELPKVARSWGKSLAEFKKGMSGIQNEFNDIFRDEPRRIPYHDPVYSHNAGTVDGHLASATTADEIATQEALHPSDNQSSFDNSDIESSREEVAASEPKLGGSSATNPANT